MMKLFCENSQRLKTVNYFRKKTPLQMFDCVLSRPSISCSEVTSIILSTNLYLLHQNIIYYMGILQNCMCTLHIGCNQRNFFNQGVSFGFLNIFFPVKLGPGYKANQIYCILLQIMINIEIKLPIGYNQLKLILLYYFRMKSIWYYSLLMQWEMGKL